MCRNRADSCRAKLPHPYRRSRSGAPFRLADLGVYGFDRHETTILASLVTEDPLLLVGRSGAGKTFCSIRSPRRSASRSRRCTG
jgi:hypothetical protein